MRNFSTVAGRLLLGPCTVVSAGPSHQNDRSLCFPLHVSCWLSVPVTLLFRLLLAAHTRIKGYQHFTMIV
jgi:hypothetical protein